MQTTRIFVQSPVDVRIAANRADIVRFTKLDDALIVYMNNDTRLIVDDFFMKGPNGEVSRLIYEDGTFSGVDGNARTIPAEESGIGLGLAALGLAGAGAAALALDDDDDDNDTPTDGTNPTDSTNPTDETNPTDSTNPTDETNPTDNTNPTDETDPTDNTNPTDETNPTDSTDPTDETNPTDSTDPTDGTDSVSILSVLLDGAGGSTATLANGISDALDQVQDAEVLAAVETVLNTVINTLTADGNLLDQGGVAAEMLVAELEDGLESLLVGLENGTPLSGAGDLLTGLVDGLLGTAPAGGDSGLLPHVETGTAVAATALTSALATTLAALEDQQLDVAVTSLLEGVEAALLAEGALVDETLLGVTDLVDALTGNLETTLASLTAGDIAGAVDSLTTSLLDGLLGGADAGNNGQISESLGGALESLLGENGLLDGLLGEDGLLGGILEPILGDGGVLGGLLGGTDGLLDPLLGEDGLLGGLLDGGDLLGGTNGLLDPVLGGGGLLGDDGLPRGLLSGLEEPAPAV